MEPSNARTPLLQDKRLLLTISTVVSLLAARFIGLELDPALLATIAATVIGYVTNSAMKEAKVAAINAEATKPPAGVEGIIPIKPVDQ